MAHLYAAKYKIPLKELKEAMARVSFKAHKWGCINPKAQFYAKKVTMEEIYESRMVASPLQVYDCCPISDGAAAIVVTSMDIAKKLTCADNRYRPGVIRFGMQPERHYTRRRPRDVGPARLQDGRAAAVRYRYL
jgi:acetyl-CoA acetyltransferase